MMSTTPVRSTIATGARTLRFVRILGDLYGDRPLNNEEDGAQQRVTGAALAHEVHATRDRPDSSTKAFVTIGEVFDRAQHAGFGIVIALLAIVSIPLVGLTLPIAVAVAAIGVQMILDFSRPWLPRFVRRRTLSLARLKSVSERVARWSAGLQRVIRPRLPWLTRGPFWTLCGVGVAVQGVALALPVPGADWLFVVPLVLYGIALLESDGLLIIVCHALTLTEVVLGVWLWDLIAGGLSDVYRWCASVWA